MILENMFAIDAWPFPFLVAGTMPAFHMVAGNRAEPVFMAAQQAHMERLTV